MAEAKALRTMATPKVRKLLFEDWWREHVTPAAGVLIPQRELFKAYCGRVDKRNRLGEQGFEAALNGLRVKRVVKQGKTYREGVTFTTRPASDPAGQPPASASRPPPSASQGEDINLQPAYRIANECLMERHRQIVAEGFDAAHDDASDPGAHERAAACYAYAAGQPDHLGPFVDFTAKTAPREGRLGWVVRDTLVMMWPWSVLWWKPKTDEPDWRRRCMVKACALLLAAIEHFDREKARATLEAAQAKDMTGV